MAWLKYNRLGALVSALGLMVRTSVHSISSTFDHSTGHAEAIRIQSCICLTDWILLSYIRLNDTKRRHACSAQPKSKQQESSDV